MDQVQLWKVEINFIKALMTSIITNHKKKKEEELFTKRPLYFQTASKGPRNLNFSLKPLLSDDDTASSYGQMIISH